MPRCSYVHTTCTSRKKKTTSVVVVGRRRERDAVQSASSCTFDQGDVWRFSCVTGRVVFCVCFFSAASSDYIWFVVDRVVPSFGLLWVKRRVLLSLREYLQVELLEIVSEVEFPLDSLWWLASRQPDCIKKDPPHTHIRLEDSSPGNCVRLPHPECRGHYQVQAFFSARWLLMTLATSSWPWWDETVI